MASIVWKGYISFGLISVPLRLYAAARKVSVSFHQIHSVCGSRIKQQLYCPVCERVVERNELAKGYPIDKESNVLVTNEELKAQEAESSEAMEIQAFVPVQKIDPIYFETSFYTVAEEPGQRAYRLLHDAMLRLDVAALAKLTLHQREQVVMVRPYRKGLILHTLYFADEVREISEYGHQPELQVLPQELELAQQFIQQLTGDFEANQFQDEYRVRVEKLIESKSSGASSAPEERSQRRLAPVVDLMEALRKSLASKEGSAEAPKKQPRKAASAARVTEKRKAG